MAIRLMAAVLSAGARLAPLVAVAVVTPTLVGCAQNGQSTHETLPDGSFRLKCKVSLPRCLDRAEELCHGTRYNVLSAADHHDYMGSQGSVGESETRASEAVVRCGTRGRKLWGEADGPDAKSGQAVAPAAVPAPGRQACVPGTTQSCVGAGACRGGQACLGDGSGFAACDCGRTGQADGGAPG